MSEIRKRKPVRYWLGKVGASSPNWKGGITKDNTEWRKNYYQKNREKLVLYSKDMNKKRRMIVLNYYGGNPAKCACCGETTYEFLTIDHMDNNGAEHRRELGTKTRGGNIYNWLIRNNFPDGFQVLCWNCNCAKGFYGKCPHNLLF